MKRTAKIVSVFLASLITIFIIPPNVIQPVYGSYGSAFFCPGLYWPPHDPSGEIELAEDTAGFYNMLESCFDESYLIMNEDADVEHYVDAIAYLSQNFDYVFFYSKGHRGRWPPLDYSHLDLRDYYNSTPGVRDSEEVFPYSSTNFRIVFLWHCETAEMYEGFYPGYEEDPIGMPFCFTHNNDMDLYGRYTGYNVFVGWEGESFPFISYVADQEPWNEYQYAHWVYYFFERLSEGGSVLDALNHATNTISNRDFTCSDLYYNLKVWGCMDIDIY